MKMGSKLARLALALAALGVSASAAMAQEWPSEKPVRVIVPFGAGTVLDSGVRIIADRLQAKYGQSFVVENITGASGTLGAAQAANSEPDGYTLLATSPGPAANAANIFPDLPYDPKTAFSQIMQMWQSSAALVAGPSAPASDIAGLIEYAKANPRTISAGHAGPGSYGQMLLLAFAESAGIEINFVPYSNSTPGILADLLAGNIQLAGDVTGGYLANAAEGKVNIMAVLTPERVPFLPDTPTLVEQGVDLSSTTWTGLQGPAGMDPALIAQINADVTEVLLNDPDLKRVLDNGAAFARPTSPEEFAQIVVAEEAMWRPIIEKYNVRVQ